MKNHHHYSGDLHLLSLDNSCVSASFVCSHLQAMSQTIRIYQNEPVQSPCEVPSRPSRQLIMEDLPTLHGPRNKTIGLEVTSPSAQFVTNTSTEREGLRERKNQPGKFALEKKYCIIKPCGAATNILLNARLLIYYILGFKHLKHAVFA